jgi:integrase
MTCATPRRRCYWAGRPPEDLSERLGHSTIAITLDLYSHVTPTMQRDAAALLDAVLRR